MSRAPDPPSRVESKYSVKPSNDSEGAPSLAGVLIGAPTFRGVDQGSAVLARVDTQISSEGAPEASGTEPTRLEVMNISRPSRLIDVRVSRRGLLSSGTWTAAPNDRWSSAWAWLV